MRTFKIAILAGCTAPIMILCGCSTVSVTTDYDHTANFGTYRTYAVAEKIGEAVKKIVEKFPTAPQSQPIAGNA